MKKEEENLATRLTARVSQVLLLLLYRNRNEVKLSLPEFATLSGLARRSTVLALAEAEESHLVSIIPHLAGQVQAQLLVKPTEPEVRAEDLSKSELLELSRKADESGEKAARLRALQMVWDWAFPEAKYPYQRMSRDAADDWLANDRSVVWLTQVILSAVEHATSEIRSPRSFIEKAIQNKEEHEAERGGGGGAVEPIITERIRKLTKLGGMQFNGKG
jgi:hypothetical protein